MNETFTRVSIRKYEDKAAEQEEIEQLLRAAMAAPSAGNQQPWEFYLELGQHRRAASAALSPKTASEFCCENLKYNQYFCVSAPHSDTIFPTKSLLPNDAVLP